MKISSVNKYNNNFRGIKDSSKLFPKLADYGESKFSFLSTKEFPLATKLSELNISGNPAFFDSFIHYTAENAEALESSSYLANLGEQAMDTLPLLALYFKYKAPLRDFQKGDIQAGIVKSGVRVGETIFLLPFKFAWAACGGILGGLKSAIGIKSDSSGITKGFMSANNNWNQVRNGLENFITSPYTFIENLKRDRKGEIIKEYEEWERKRISQIEDDVNFLALNKQQSLVKNHQRTMDMLSSTELHIDQLLSTIPPSKPITVSKLKDFCKKNDNESIKDLVDECIQQQSEYESFYKDSMQEIEKILNNSSTNKNEKDIINRIMQKIQHYYDTTIKVNTENIQSLSKIIAINNFLYKKANLKGFAKIAGYDKLKQQINNTFLKRIRMYHAGKDVDLPNMILFFGPQGCGKTMFSSAIAEEAHCNLINLQLCLSEQKNLNNIIDAVENAKRTFEETGLFTIIKIDEYDALSFKDQELKSRFIKMINSVSKNNHCTIVATSNFSDSIDNQLLPQKIKSYHLEPATNKDLKLLLEFYLKDNNFVNTETIDYSEIIKAIQKHMQNNYFSNARIVKILKNLLINSKEIDTKTTINTFLKESPDIADNEMKLYRKGMI